MPGINFFTPVHYGNQPKSASTSVMEAFDHYFYLGGKKACVIAGRMERGKEGVVLVERSSSYLLSALKVVSYFTIVIPLIVLIVKAVLRYKNQFYVIDSSSPEQLVRTDALVHKYCSYNRDYENPGTLLDALFTGCRFPYTPSTFNVYTPEIENDIKEIVRLTPQSMNCTLGTLRSRDNVSPLAAACFNTNIPLHIIEFLFQQGADPNATLDVNGHPVRILADLESNMSAERFAAIKALFIRYGAVVE